MNKEERKQSALETRELYLKAKYNKAESKLELVPDEIPTKKHFNTKIIVEDNDVVKRVVETARNGSTGVLNFASATNPGGGYETGAAAQEESLCRNSFLGFELNRPSFMKTYYGPNRKNKNQGLYVSNFIYSKNVPFVKEPRGNQEVILSEPVFCDVVTMAAPNKNIARDSDGKQLLDEKVYTKDLAIKIQKTLRAFKEHSIENLILGAFGCGVFGNDPKKVAKLFNVILNTPEFKGAFKTIYFTIFGKGENLTAFQNEFKK